MKLFYLLILIAAFSCKSEIREMRVECPLFDSISFERPIRLDDPDLEKFLRPINWIDSAIIANNIIPDTVLKNIAFDTSYIEFWTFDQKVVKMQERRVDFLYDPGVETTLTFYTLNACNWYHVMEKRPVRSDSLISFQILNFNESDYVNYIYTTGPEPVQVFTSKSPETYPIIATTQVANYYYGLQNEIEYHNSCDDITK